MTCSDVQRVLPEFLDDAPDGAFPVAFDAHVKSCPACSDLVSDLKLISSEARQLAETEEPPPRVWVRIAAELRAEGLIRDTEPSPGRPILVPSSRRRQWSAWWLAPITAALVVAGSYVVSHKPAPQVAKQQPALTAPSPTPGPAKSPVPDTVAATTPVPAPTPQVRPAQQGVKRQQASPVVMAHRDVESGPNTEDQQFLSVVSTLGPSTRASYENQLQAVNNDIRETQAYVDRYPGDADARQHLMDAYQQKALLYQIALDRIQ